METNTPKPTMYLRYKFQHRDQNCKWVTSGYFDSKVECFRAAANSAFVVDIPNQQIIITTERYYK